MSLARQREEKKARGRHRKQYWSDTDKTSYRCPVCGRGNDLVHQFEIHHIDGDPLNGDDENLIALCWWCHLQANGKAQQTLPFDEWCSGFLTLGSRDSRPEDTRADGGGSRKWWSEVMDDE
jgi:hypothetical protein